MTTPREAAMDDRVGLSRFIRQMSDSWPGLIRIPIFLISLVDSEIPSLLPLGSTVQVLPLQEVLWWKIMVPMETNMVPNTFSSKRGKVVATPNKDGSIKPFERRTMVQVPPVPLWPAVQPEESSEDIFCGRHAWNTRRWYIWYQHFPGGWRWYRPWHQCSRWDWCRQHHR